MLNWGILSTGNIARQFAGSFKTAQHGRLVAVASRSADAARTFATQFAIPTAYPSYLQLLSDPSIHAVYNALPNTLHHTYTLAALRAGKHVLCEKPMATTPAEVQEMFDVARQHGRLLVEAFMYRSHPLTKSYIAAIHAGQIGTVQLIRASFSFRVLKPDGNIRFSRELAGGALMDVGCYCIDFARLVTAESPNRVHAVATHNDAGIDVLAAATLGHPSGALATFSIGMTAHADNTATICGTEGYIEVPIPWKPPVTGAMWRLGRSVPTRMDQTPATTSTAPSMSIGADKQTFTIDAGKDLYALEADDFAQAVAGKSPPPITERESIENAHVMARIRASL